MPVHMLLVTFLTAAVIYGLIVLGNRLGIIVTVLCLLLCFLLGVYYVFLIGRGSSFSDEMELALISRKRVLTTKYLLRLHAAFSPVQPKVGIFFPLKGRTVGTMVSTSIEMAVDMMLI